MTGAELLLFGAAATWYNAVENDPTLDRLSDKIEREKQKALNYKPTNNNIGSVWKLTKNNNYYTIINNHFVVTYPGWMKNSYKLPGNVGKYVMIEYRDERDKVTYPLHNLLLKKHRGYKKLDDENKLIYLQPDQLRTLEHRCITDIVKQLNPDAPKLPRTVRHLTA